jgi:hypothetical protein
MNDKDKEAFEKWFKDFWSVSSTKHDCFSGWQAACEYMRNRSPLDPVSLYDKLEQERDQAIELLEAHTAQFYTVSDGDWSVKFVADYPQDVKRFLEKVKK